MTTPRSAGPHCPGTAVPVPPGSRPLRWPAVFALHLLPGAGLATVHVLVTPVLVDAGLPGIWAVLGGILFVVVPIEGGLVLRYRRAGGGAVLGLGTLRHRPPRRIALVTAAVLVASLALSATASLAEPALRDLVTSALPGLPSAGPGDLAALGPGTTALTLAAWVLAAVVVGPVVEEAYFRGWLQPRIPAAPLPAAGLGTALFTGYHLWQPAAWLTVLGFVLPVAVLAARTRATALGAVVHVTVNALAFAGLCAGLLTR